MYFNQSSGKELNRDTFAGSSTGWAFGYANIGLTSVKSYVNGDSGPVLYSGYLMPFLDKAALKYGVLNIGVIPVTLLS